MRRAKSKATKKPYRPMGYAGVLVWLHPEDRALLREVSERTGESQQDILRKSLRRTLDRHVRVQEGE